MVGSVPERASRTLEFGMYRDGDNNLDEVQSATLAQAVATSKADRTIAFTVEDTTARRGLEPAGTLRTEEYSIADGSLSKTARIERPHDMSARDDLAHFVAHVLDDAEASHATQTWVDLIDHGGGDGGGLQSDHGDTRIMREDDIAGAIADGVALHAREHPEDAGRAVDGVVANQCLMATVAFSSALSHAGVRYLAASPETMLAPGVPTQVAHDIAAHAGDPAGMAQAVVDTTMDTHYDMGGLGSFGPAAAFDVIDLDPAKTAAVARTVRALDASLAATAHDPAARAAIREDARGIDGMVRFPEGKALPWRADRPAVALYDTFAHDARLSTAVRAQAATAEKAVAATVLAHRESASFAPFGGSSYADAGGPTVHFPVTPKQIDTWGPQISETDNAFYKSVGAAAVAKVIA